MSRTKVFIHFVRLFALLSRAGIVFLIAKSLSHDDVAIFSLVSSTSALLVIFFGFDFTRYVQREMSNRCASEGGGYIGPLLAFVVSSNLLLGGLLAAIAFILGVDGYVILSLMAVTFFEHISQELGRLLVFYNKQLHSALALFIRTALPVTVLVGFVFCGFKFDVYDIFFIMALFSSASFFYSLIALSRVTKIRMPRDLDFVLWFKTGLLFSLFFFLSTVSVKMIFAIDKLALSLYFDNEVLANYAIALSAAMVVVPVVDILVGSYSLPKFYALKNQEEALSKAFYKNFNLTLVLIFSFYLFGAPVFKMLTTRWLESYEHITYQFCYIVFLAPCFYALALVPSQVLTVLEDLKVILFSSLLMLFSFLFVFLLTYNYYYSVPISMAIALAAFSFVRLCRSLFLVKVE